MPQKPLSRYRDWLMDSSTVQQFSRFVFGEWRCYSAERRLAFADRHSRDHERDQQKIRCVLQVSKGELRAVGMQLGNVHSAKTVLVDCGCQAKAIIWTKKLNQHPKP
jgi:hypothetical protein